MEVILTLLVGITISNLFMVNVTWSWSMPREASLICMLARQLSPTSHTLRWLTVEDTIVEMHKGYFVVNGVQMSYKDSLPFTQGPFTIVQTVGTKMKQVYQASFHGSSIEFKFYKQFLTVGLSANSRMADATGLLGEFSTGDMYKRDGAKTEGLLTFVEHAFEWQVNPDDVQLFLEARQPQLPFEQCRMPTESRPARRHLRSDAALLKQAEEACFKVHPHDLQLCVDDVMITSDIGLAEEAW
eukprot:scaffold4223_cov189-Amphora_coffeaeformis.AAC.57